MQAFLAALGVYAQPRVLAVLCLGFASGLPLALTGQTLQARLTEEGLSLGTIGLFAAATTPYTLKFLWAPLVDKLEIPLLAARFGRRRSWLLAVQAVLIVAIVLLGANDPKAALWTTALLTIAVAAASATQDIVIDAWRVEMLEESQQGAGAAAIIFGYRIGMLASGAGALYLASFVDWFTTYAAMAALLLVGVGVGLLADEPRQTVLKEDAERRAEVESWLAARPALRGPIGSALAWLYVAVAGPFLEFLRRPGWLALLAFAMLYKFGDAFAGAVSTSFYLMLGFTKIEIANVAKIYGTFATLLGFFLGGWLMRATGLIRALWICGILQLVSNFLFVVLAEAGPDIGLLSLAVGVENLSGGMGTAVFVAYLSSLCNVAYTATQFALLSALAAVARTWLSAPAGHVAQAVGWSPFFLVSVAAAVPGLVLLWWIGRSATHQIRSA
jgi:PAT family beta-lactamase induction signal transducer AmpG